MLDHWKSSMKQQVVPSFYFTKSSTAHTKREERDAPLAIFVSRFDSQKGVELVLEALETWFSGGGLCYILGSGSKSLETRVSSFAARHPEQCKVTLGFHLKLAHQLFAAADLCLIPSRFEPCGLTQMQAMRYGVPLATPVGGLCDSIIPLISRVVKFLLNMGMVFSLECEL